MIYFTGGQNGKDVKLSFVKLYCQLLLARACGVPVGRRSGGRLAMTLVATINLIIFFFLFFFLFFSFFSSPSSTFLIEEVLGSKNLFSES